MQSDPSTAPTVVNIAIKTLKNVDEEGYDIEKEWKNEAEAHWALDELDSEHLVQMLAAYSHWGSYCLLFEWADGGNMRSYWKSFKYENLSAEMILGYLQQIHGIAHALMTMHYSGPTPSPQGCHTVSGGSKSSIGPASVDSPGNSNVAQPAGSALKLPREHLVVLENGAQVQSRQGSVQNFSETPKVQLENVDVDSATLEQSDAPDDAHWQHRDVKPENILRFKDGKSSLGTLKLSDFGRTKQHFLATKNRAIVEHDRWRTKTYEPPDIYIFPDKTTSRLFDVWSLGCVIFEAIVLMLDGEIWVEPDSGEDRENETPFWVRKGKKYAEIHPIFRKRVEDIFKNDPECQERTPSALGDLLRLVYGKMLVIEVPPDSEMEIDGMRTNAKVVCRELDEILKRAKDPRYLFTGKPREQGIVELLPKSKRAPSVLPKRSEVSTSQHQSLITLSPRKVKASSRSPPERYDTYSQIPVNRWTYENDDKFARDVYQQIMAAYNEECLDLTGQVLCKSCRLLNLMQIEVLPSRKVQDLKTTCSICVMLLTPVHEAGLIGAQTITLVRNESGLSIRSAAGAIGQLRLCRPLGKP